MSSQYTYTGTVVDKVNNCKKTENTFTTHAVTSRLAAKQIAEMYIGKYELRKKQLEISDAKIELTSGEVFELDFLWINTSTLTVSKLQEDKK